MLMRINTLSFPGLGINEFDIATNAISIKSFSIAWYSLIITTGILVAVLYVWRRFKENKMKLDDLLDMAIWTVMCGIIGARLYYIIFRLDYYVASGYGGFFPNLWESIKRMVAVWEGGLAIYGGIIGGGLAACLVARKKKMKLYQILDFLAPAVMLAQSIGRWGNFFNVEAYGGPTTLPWRMCSPKIAHELLKDGIVDSQGYAEVLNGTLGVHPTFFYESLWNLIGFLAIYFLLVRSKRLHKFDGQIFYTYIAWYGFGRMLIEGLRTDSLYLFGVIRISQLVGLACFIVGTVMLTLKFIKLRKAKKNG